MKIRILDAAQQDLVNGFRFYEAQSQGLGSYFLDSLYAEPELFNRLLCLDSKKERQQWV